VYVVVGAAIWLAVLKSGVHPTVAGVLLGLLTPANPWVGARAFRDVLGDMVQRLRDDHDGQVEYYHKPLLGQLAMATREALAPLERLETALHPWVAFGVMPVFALANAGVRLQPAAFGQPVGVAVGLGLLIGKPLGIMLFSWLAVSLGLARLPTGVNWLIMLGGGCLAGIGFTMSLFIAGLALDGDLLEAGKIGTMTGSILSAILGSLLLLAFLPKRATSNTRGAATSH
jgi:NhaA family Na+:H+ antiporter